MNLHRASFYFHNFQKLARLWLKDREATAVIKQVRADKLTYLEPAALIDLHTRVTQVEQQGLSGIMIEAGCALGGSALVIAAGKQPDRPLYLYDAFEMIPPPSTADGADAQQRFDVIASGQATGIKGGTYYGYRANLLAQVQHTFTHYGFETDEQHIHFVKGFYEDTLAVNQPVALAHIDCDWHDSVMTCLQRIEPHLVSGGVLIIDDYKDWSGCRTAVDTYFANRQDEFVFEMKSRLHIVRK